MSLTFFQSVTTALANPIYLAIIAFLSWWIRNEILRRQSIERQLSERKYKLYIDIITLAYEFLSPKILTKNSNLLFDKHKDILIFASDGVLKIFNKFQNEAYSAKGLTEDEKYLYISELMLEIRKDMGYPRTKISKSEIIETLFRKTSPICELSPSYADKLKKLLKG